MEKILLVMLTCLYATCGNCIDIQPGISSEDTNGPQNDFWPPDLVPHPHPPWNQPSGPSEPEMA